MFCFFFLSFSLIFISKFSQSIFHRKFYHKSGHMLLLHGALNLCRVTLEIKCLCWQSSLPYLISITKHRKRRKISPEVLRVKHLKGWGMLTEGEVPAAAQQEPAVMLQVWHLSKAVPVIENSQSTRCRHHCKGHRTLWQGCSTEHNQAKAWKMEEDYSIGGATGGQVSSAVLFALPFLGSSFLRSQGWRAGH